ncbi:hypothetical protein U8P73_33025 (plasmid) [Rhizobium beringeri]|nr:hypothetical protein U8P73_33025 [Rhizobium beringeri]
MFGKLKTLAITLHKDERGDMAQIVLAVALIVIPLMLLLLAFGKQIGEWFNEKEHGALGCRENSRAGSISGSVSWI